MRKLLQAHIDSRGPGEAAAPVQGADGVERDRPRIHERELGSVFGGVDVKRLGYRADGVDSLHPLDAELNLPVAFAEAESRDLDHRKKWVALVDGNAEQSQTLHLLAAARGLNLTIILDLIHVCEYLWKASLCSHTEDDPAREVWVQERLLRILEGKSSHVAAGMTRSATIPRRGTAHRHRGHRGRLSLLGEGPHGHHRGALAPAFSRGRTSAARPAQERGLRRVLDRGRHLKRAK
jgi:hypothetical protein